MLLKQIVSYLWPLTKKIKTANNGLLEINWINGKKYLDSKNANYSYGTLQRVLEFGLEKTDFSSIKNVLLLGLGGGSVIHSLRKKIGFRGNITAVEIDEVVIEIAENEFKVSGNENLKIIREDARLFVESCKNKFGLVIIDLFIDTRVHDDFYSMKFWEGVIRLMDSGGFFIFNAGMGDEGNKKADFLYQKLKQIIYPEKFDRVEGGNTLLIGKKVINIL